MLAKALSGARYGERDQYGDHHPSTAESHQNEAKAQETHESESRQE